MRKINVKLKKSELTPEIVKELLHYNPMAGSFHWKERDIKWFRNEMPDTIAMGYCARWNAKNAGKLIRSSSIQLLGSTYRLADLAYFIVEGKWSKTYGRLDKTSLVWNTFYEVVND